MSVPATTLRLGTRRSALATTQSAWVADRLRALGHRVELVEIVTEGDTSTASLASLGGTLSIRCSADSQMSCFPFPSCFSP